MARERWKSKNIFILAAIGSAVGLGNAWRFPGQAFENGGGAFLIPYFVALITAGIPLLVLEHAIGKKFQKGAPGALGSVRKPFEALGWWALATSFVIVAYYCVVMAWVFDYLWNSLTVSWKGGAKDFFLGNILQISDSPGHLGGFSIPVLIGLVLTWLLVWFCIRNGVKSVGRVVKWTVPLPIILLVILGIRAVTLPGAADGIRYYLTPNWKELTNINVWAAAYGQIFFSLSVLFGIMIAYASYLPKKSDIPRNAIIIAISNSAVSLLAGFAVFGTLGYLAQLDGVGIADLSYSGPYLAFITYPAAIATLPGGQIVAVLFSLIFFIMLLTLGIDSAFSIVEGIVAGLVDKFGWSKKKTIIAVCTVGFVGSLLFATKAGLYWLDIIDHWVNDFSLIAIGVVESIAIGWVFGAKKLRKEFNEFATIKFGAWWDIMIKFVTPAVLLYISISYLIHNIKVPYGGYEIKYLLIGGWGVVFLTIATGVVLTFLKGTTTVSQEFSEE